MSNDDNTQRPTEADKAGMRIESGEGHATRVARHPNYVLAGALALLAGTAVVSSKLLQESPEATQQRIQRDQENLRLIIGATQEHAKSIGVELTPEQLLQIVGKFNEGVKKKFGNSLPEHAANTGNARQQGR